MNQSQLFAHPSCQRCTRPEAKGGGQQQCWGNYALSMEEVYTTYNKNCTYIVNGGRQEDDDAGDVENKDGGEENQHDDCAAERKAQL